MKKVLLTAVILLITSSLLVFAAPKEKAPKAPKAPKGGAAVAAEPYHVDLTKMTLYSIKTKPDALDKPLGNLVKNQTPLTKDWEEVVLVFPDDMPDLTKYNRVTIFGQFYNSKNEPIAHTHSLGMISMIYDPSKNWRADSGGNTVFKDLNFMGGAMVSQASGKGMRITLNSNPKVLILQRNAGSPAAYIEVTAIIFHSGNYSLE